MKQSSKRLYSMILALVFLVAALFFFFDLIEPTYGDLQTAKGTELSNQALLSTEQQTVAEAKSLLAEYQTDTAGQASLALAMPSGPDVSGALGQIYGIAENNNLSVQTISVGTPILQLPQSAESANGTPIVAIVKPIGTISFQVSATGNYEGLQSFLSQLQTNIRLFDVTAFSVQPIASAATGPKGVPLTQDLFTYTFTVATYYQLP